MAETRREFLAECRQWNKTFFADNVGRYYVEYVRGPVSDAQLEWSELKREYHGDEDKLFLVKGPPTAVMVALLRPDGRITVGWSAARQQVAYPGLLEYRPAESFSKVEGLWRATRRAMGLGRECGYPPSRLDVSGFRERATQHLTRKQSAA